MGNYSSDLQLAGSWRSVALDLLRRFDLEPAIVSSAFAELDLAAGSQQMLSIQAPRDLWLFGVRVETILTVVDEQGTINDWYSDLPRFVSVMVRRNQSEVLGAYVDAVQMMGDTSFEGFGPGLYVRQGETFQIDLRRLRALSDRTWHSQLFQASLCCSYLHPRGSYCFTQVAPDGSVQQLRNVPRELWGAGSCVLRHQQYEADADVDTTQIGIPTQLDIRTGDKPFCCDRIQFFAYPTAELEEITGGPYLLAPYAAHGIVQGDPLNDLTNPTAGAAWGGLSSYNPYRWRIPRWIPADSLVRFTVYNPPFAGPGEKKYLVHLSGFEFWGGEAPQIPQA